jgi:hypothetical protein
MVKYTLEQRIFLYDSYVRKKPYKSWKRRFCHRYPGVRIPLHQRFWDWWKKVRSTGSFLDKKYTWQNAVLTEETLDETGARLEHSPRKSLAQLAQQAQVSKTTAWRATKNLHLRPYKITQVQVIEECDCGRRTHFCNWFLQAAHDGVWSAQNLHFSLMTLGSIWVSISMLKTIGTGAVLIRSRRLKCPFTIRRLVCGVPLLLHE